MIHCISKPFIDLNHILFLLYLLLPSCFPTPNLQDFIKNFGALINDIHSAYAALESVQHPEGT